jgi:hypothetical protein
MRKVYHLPSACPITTGQTTTRGDGLLSVRAAAQLLQVSPSLIQWWAQRGILVKDQRVAASKLWVRVNESDMARLDGSADATQLATIPEIMPARRLSRSEVWDEVRQGHYLTYRIARGRCWEWRLRPCDSSEQIAAPPTCSV